MGGLNSFFVVALGTLYNTPPTLANVALTALLLMNALGVLVGGVLASRTNRHAVVAAMGLAGAGLGTALVTVVGFSSPALIVLASISGLSVGIASPSRDMLVRAVTPRGRLWARVRFCLLRIQHRRHDRADDLRNADGSRPAAGRVSVFRDLQHRLHRHRGLWIFRPRAAPQPSPSTKLFTGTAFRQAWKASQDVLNGAALPGEPRWRKSKCPHA